MINTWNYTANPVINLMKKNIKKNVYLCIPEPLCRTAETGKHYKSAILQ